MSNRLGAKNPRKPKVFLSTVPRASRFDLRRKDPLNGKNGQDLHIIVQCGSGLRLELLRPQCSE